MDKSLAERGIKIELGKKKGRSLMSLTQREPGDVIIQERAIATCVIPEFQHSICHNCLVSSPNLLRCSACKRARYCNRECQKVDWSLHVAECDISCRLPGEKRIPTLLMLLIRMLKKNEIVLKSREYTEADAFCAEIQLIGSQEKLSENIKVMFCQYVQALTEKSNEKLQVHPKLAYRALEKLYTNTYSVMTEELVPVAAGVYSLASLLNHSCRPNCVQHFSGNQITIRAIESVGVGEELTVSYIDIVQRLGERREELMKGYLFNCECTQCMEEYDKPMELDKYSTVLREIREFRKQKQWKNILEITQHVFEVKDSVHGYDSIRVMEQVMDSHIELGNWEEAVTLCKILSTWYAEIGVAVHYPLVALNMVKLAKLFLQLNYLEEGMECIERGMRCVRVCYGEEGAVYHSLSEMYSATRIELIQKYNAKK